MIETPKTIADFSHAAPWWRPEIYTEIRPSSDGVGDLLKALAERGKRPFFVIDDALVNQGEFAPLLERDEKFLFAASDSEPGTGDVDALTALLKRRKHTGRGDVIVAVGGGGTMDLAKAAGICMANPKPAAEYQGYGLVMEKGNDVWVLPTLPGTGAEVTPIAVLRGPEKKLGINNIYTAAAVAVVDPSLSRHAKKFNRFYTMMDCFFHHNEITKSKTSEKLAAEDARDGLAIARDVLSHDLSEYGEELAVKSSMASVLGGSSSIGGRVGVSHAISYGLSNSAPKLPHSVAVTISMLACGDIYNDGGYDDTLRFLDINRMERPRASEYGIGAKDLDKMTKTALGMEKLWRSHFGDDWQTVVNEDFIKNIYINIINA